MATTVRFLKNPPWCEHCGELSAYSGAAELDGIAWCLSCLYANDEITDSELEKYGKIEERKQAEGKS